jgi:hypothetical protein
MQGFYLLEYSLIPATVVKINKKSLKIKTQPAWGLISFEKNISPNKFIEANVPFCVVWELWKGKNGRGAYRIETELYPEFHKIGPRSTTDLVYEKQYGVREK